MMFRTLLLAFFLVFLCALPAMAEKPSLDGGNVLMGGRCTFDHVAGYCFLVEKEGVHYVALWDRMGERAIYLLKQEPEGDMIEDRHLSILWSRNDA